MDSSKTVLTVIDIADIDFEPGQPPGIVQAFEYFAGALRRLKRLIVFANRIIGWMELLNVRPASIQLPRDS